MVYHTDEVTLGRSPEETAQGDSDLGDASDEVSGIDSEAAKPAVKIEVRGLVKQFGPFVAVGGVSLSVDKGSVLGFLGPNGAGKTTTMKIITGFLKASAGDIEICGYSIATQPLQAKRMIGYLPEGAPAYAEMTPSSYLSFVAGVRGFRGQERQQRVRNVVAKLELHEVLHQPIETLSKGFRCRVGLAQALLHDPPVMILDEPTDGLDPNQKYQVRRLIKEMAPDKAIIISTHILEEVEAVCNQSVIIARGQVVARGHPIADNSGRWRFGEHEIAAGQLDQLFRQVTSEPPARAGRRRRKTSTKSRRS